MRDVSIFAYEDEAMAYYKRMCQQHGEVEIESIDRTWEGVKLVLNIIEKEQ